MVNTSGKRQGAPPATASSHRYGLAAFPYLGVVMAAVVDDDEQRCSSCAQPVPDGARFCGRCGGLVPGAASVESRSAPSSATSTSPRDRPAPRSDADVEPEQQRASPVLGRRSLLIGTAGVLVGGVLGAAWTRRGALEAAEVAETPEGALGFGIEVGTVAEVLRELAQGRPVLLPEDTVDGAVVRWNPTVSGERGLARDIYGVGGEDHPVLDGTTGLLALSLRAPGSGCRVQYCVSSGFFEDPCQGSLFNAWGEWVDGPAGRGLDRFPSRVRSDGMLVVEVSRYLTGPRREDGLLTQPRRGPNCVDAAS